jgi:hypothetical protein
VISKGSYINAHSSSDSDVIPLAVELVKANEDGWDRALFELFPDFRHSADLADAEFSDDPDEEPKFMQRSTKELLYRLRKQVPSSRSSVPKRGARKSIGTGIFS